MTAKKTTKQRRYVTRWIVAYEWLAPWGRWGNGIELLHTREEARDYSKTILHDSEKFRNIMPPQAVRVRVK